MRIDPCPDCGAYVNTNGDHETTCPRRQAVCRDCGRLIGCNADCEDMNCEHCYCYRDGRDG
ncbi:hypothetical protein SEA_SHROOMS_44 [Arthrobacter phage Shrooms]|nr:hypothetical protein SEA_SHROOMS_44 [Arthrobacter phage Shrooms]